MQLIFATHNQHKLEEVQKMIGNNIELQSLSDINFNEEVEETGNSFKENALIKAKAIYNIEKKPVFADDSGICVEALNNAPGIYSSRYAGTGKSEDNIKKLLSELEGKENRNAYFIAVICLILHGKEYFFEGKIEGKIIEHLNGTNGFGYDPIFKPIGETLTFAEMSANEKNKISHRAKAVQNLKEFIQEL